LAEIGAPAHELLGKAAKDATDLETRTRAADVARGMDRLFLQEVRRFQGYADETDHKVTRVVVSPDGRRAVSSGSAMLRYWDIQSSKQILDFGPIPKPCYWVLTLSKDGARAIAGGHDNIARVFDLATGKQLQQFVGHTGNVSAAILLGDGSRALTASAPDRSIRLWDVQTGNQTLAFDQTGDAVRCMGVSPDGKILVAAHFPEGKANNGTLRLWDIGTGKTLGALEGSTTATGTVSFSPDGKTVLDGTLRLWDVATRKELKPFKDRPEGILYAVFTPDGKRILTGGENPRSTLRVWDVATGELILESEKLGGGILCVAALPDNERCMTATRDGVIRLWQWKR